MARIDFPSNPSDGQTLTVTVAGANTVYTYNATHGVWRSLASRESYLQVANLQPALDKYLQVANSTSFSTTGQLDAYLQVANSTGLLQVQILTHTYRWPIAQGLHHLRISMPTYR